MLNGAEAISSLVFVIIAIAQVVVSFIVFSYAGYCFLEILVSTASGDDEVIWPGDPMVDWIWKLWYLFWIIAIWAVPIYILLGYHRLNAGQFAVALAAFLWIVFPVSLLSSLSGSSRWLIFRPSIVRSLLKDAGTLAVFYIVTGVILGVAGGLAYWSLVSPLIYWVPVAAACGALAFLLYARLLGRMALAISLNPAGAMEDETEEAADSAENPPSSEPKDVPSQEPKRVAVETSMPEAVAPEHHAPAHEPEPSVPLEPSAPIASAAANPAGPESDLQPYGLAPPEATAPVSVPDYAPPPERGKEEFKLAVSYDVPPPPKRPLWDGVYSFPFYNTTLGPLAFLTIGFLAVLGVFRVLVAYFPFAEQ